MRIEKNIHKHVLFYNDKKLDFSNKLMKRVDVVLEELDANGGKYHHIQVITEQYKHHKCLVNGQLSGMLISKCLLGIITKHL